MAVINIRGVPDDLHVRVKVQAAKESIPLRELVMKALEEYLDRHERKRG
jgi:plasmid stability protein